MYEVFICTQRTNYWFMNMLPLVIGLSAHRQLLAFFVLLTNSHPRYSNREASFMKYTCTILEQFLPRLPLVQWVICTFYRVNYHSFPHWTIILVRCALIRNMVSWQKKTSQTTTVALIPLFFWIRRSRTIAAATKDKLHEPCIKCYYYADGGKKSWVLIEFSYSWAKNCPQHMAISERHRQSFHSLFQYVMECLIQCRSAVQET